MAPPLTELSTGPPSPPPSPRSPPPPPASSKSPVTATIPQNPSRARLKQPSANSRLGNPHEPAAANRIRILLRVCGERPNSPHSSPRWQDWQARRKRTYQPLRERHSHRPSREPRRMGIHHRSKRLLYLLRSHTGD